MLLNDEKSTKNNENKTNSRQIHVEKILFSFRFFNFGVLVFFHLEGSLRIYLIEIYFSILTKGKRLISR